MIFFLKQLAWSFAKCFQRRNVSRKQSAFTLFEMVVALSVFMILMGGVFQALLFGVRVQESLKKERTALMETRLWIQDFESSLKGGEFIEAELMKDLLFEDRQGLEQALAEEVLGSPMGEHTLEWVDVQGNSQRLFWDTESKQLFWNDLSVYGQGVEVTQFRYEFGPSLLRWHLTLEYQGQILLDFYQAHPL